MPEFAGYVRFDPTPDSVARARRLVEPLLRQLPAPVAQCLQLVVSELATNAVRHARTAYELAVRLFPTVRVEVADGSPTPVVPKQPATTDESGRGLLIVDRCAQRWGVAERPPGKVVWAELYAFAAPDGDALLFDPPDHR
jgi:anti-sigma regulatory factor (Ser/Thr protein kinase)